MLTGDVAENQLDSANMMLASQKLLAYDTPEAEAKRNGENFSMYKIPIGGMEYFPTAMKQGPLQTNQVSPGLTTELVDKVQTRLKGVEMLNGRFEFNSNTDGNMDEYVRYPAVRDTLDADNNYIPQGTWATATISSLLTDNRKHPNFTVGFQQRPCPALQLGGCINQEIVLSPMLQYLRTIRLLWVPTGKTGDICPDSCRYRCIDEKVFGSCSLLGFAGIPINQTNF